jgi:hypothetical protein
VFCNQTVKLISVSCTLPYSVHLSQI